MMIFLMLLFSTIVISGSGTKQMNRGIKEIVERNLRDTKNVVPFEKETFRVFRELVLDSKKLMEEEDAINQFYFDFNREQVEKIIDGLTEKFELEHKIVKKVLIEQIMLVVKRGNILKLFRTKGSQTQLENFAIESFKIESNLLKNLYSLIQNSGDYEEFSNELLSKIIGRSLFAEATHILNCKQEL